MKDTIQVFDLLLNTLFSHELISEQNQQVAFSVFHQRGSFSSQPCPSYSGIRNRYLSGIPNNSFYYSWQQ